MADRKTLNARMVAGSLLATSVGQSSTTVDRFSVWLFAGFGAAIGLLFANLDNVLLHIAEDTLRRITLLFVWSIPLAVLERYLAVLISAGATGAERGRDIFSVTGIPEREVDLHVFIQEMSRPVPRFVGNWIRRRLKEEDLAAFGRFLMRMVQVQGVLVMAQVVLLFVAALSLATSLVA